MEVNTIAKLLIAVTVAHGLHSVMEPVNILKKVKELQSLVNKQKPTVKIPRGIDTRAKSYFLGFISFGLVFVIIFGALSFVRVDIKASMIFSIIILIGIEVINTISIDRYHVEIEKVAKKFRK